VAVPRLDRAHRGALGSHLRHSFAVRTLIDAYRTDGDVGPRVSLLVAVISTTPAEALA
jgi:hypothetical protein